MIRVLVIDNEEDRKFSPLFDQVIKSDDFNGLLKPQNHYFILGYSGWNKVLESGMHIGLRGDSSPDKVSALKFLNIGKGCVVCLMKSSTDLLEELKKKMKAKKEVCYKTDSQLLQGIRDRLFLKVRDKMMYFFQDPSFGKAKVDGLGDDITFVTDNSQVEDSFKRLESWTESEFGLDYETSGLTHEKDFAVIGVGISTNKFAVYFEWRLLDLETFLPRYKQFLDNFANKCWVRNVDFEQEATYRYLSKFYNFKELAALRVIEGYPSMQAGSLKYITRDELGVPSWDDAYDDLLDNSADEVWKTYVSKHYPDYLAEFEKFDSLGYNTSFTRIPTKLIGTYCCYDSYYTLMCYEVNKDKYSPLCWDVYLNNYLARNRMTGIFVNSNELDVQTNYACTFFLMGTYYCVREYFKMKIKQLGELPDYIKKDYFLLNNITYLEGKASDVAKKMLANVRDENVPKFINIDKWNEIFNDEILLSEMYNLLPDAWEISTIGRKRKVCERLQLWLKERQENVDLSNLGELLELHTNNNKLLNNNFGDKTQKELLEMKTVQLCGKTLTKVDAAKYIQKNIYKLTAAEVFAEFESSMNSYLGKKNKIRKALTYLSKGLSELKQITGLENYKDIYERFNRDRDCKKALDNTDLADNIRISLRDDKWFANSLPGEVRKYVNNDDEFYCIIDDMEAPSDEVLAFYKFKVYRDMFKKYGKILSTYLNSIMSIYNRVDNKPDDNLHSVRWFGGESTEGTVIRSYPKFLNNSVLTKRWSSGFHTLPADSAVKRIVDTPKGYLASYFDVNSAEVRSIAWLSNDEKMIGHFKAGRDIYIECARLYYPDYSEKELKGARKIFKIVLLGLMYGMTTIGMQQLIGNITLEECERAKDLMLGQFPSLKKFIEIKSKYPLTHNGKIDTILGDIIISKDEIDKQERQGINACVQNFTAVILVQGFFNIIKNSDIDNYGIQNIIYVHDSSINYFPLDKLWSIDTYYNKHFRAYLNDLVGIDYKFKTLVGTNYWDMGILTHLTPDTTSIEGSATTIINIANKLTESGIPFETNIPISDLEVKWKDINRCILDFSEEPWFGFDTSEYTVEFKRL